jgi:thiamine kinase-like enzyme
MSRPHNASLTAARRTLRHIKDSETFERFLMDPGSMRAFFQRRLPAMYPDHERVKRVTVRHQPALSTTSFLMHYYVDLIRASGSNDRKSIRGNFVDPATYRIMEAVFRHRKPSYTSMRPLLFDARRRYEFYEEVPGASLRNVPFRSARFPKLIAPIAHALADFHSVPTAKLRPLSWDKESASITLNVERIRRQLPAYRRRITACSALLAQAEQRLWHANRSIVHNDFQASNVIIDGTKVGLIDFTLSAVGNAAIDVGNFLAHLTVMLHGVLPPARIERIRRTFLNAYLSRTARSRRAAIRGSVPVFELRSCIDILAITLINLGPKDKNRDNYRTLLQQRIEALVRDIARA